MKTIFLFNLAMLITLCTIGQSKYEQGYFINNNDQKIDCLIKKTAWRKNPSGFHYRLNGNDSTGKGTLENAKEFGLQGGPTFIRFLVNIDRSSEETDHISTLRNPIWTQEQLFLKLLVKGRASLYSYEEGNLTRFFYSTGDSTPQQLIHKSYIYYLSYIDINNDFRQQLRKDVY